MFLKYENVQDWVEYVQHRRHLSFSPWRTFALFSLNCLPKPGSDIRAEPAQPHFFYLTRGMGHTECDKKEKTRKGLGADRQVCACVLACLGSILKTVKRAVYPAGGPGHGGLGVSTWEHGTTEDF